MTLELETTHSSLIRMARHSSSFSPVETITGVAVHGHGGKFPDIYNYTFVNNEDEIYFSFSVNDNCLLLRTVVDDSGIMNRLSWHENEGQWNEYWSAP